MEVTNCNEFTKFSSVISYIITFFFKSSVINVTPLKIMHYSSDL